MRSDEFFSDLQNFRNPNQMKTYFLEKRSEILESEKRISEARLKKGKFKVFLEEFYYLYCFSQTRFCSSSSKMKIVIGNQPYDAIIVEGDYEQKYEITCYIDGKFENDDAKLLNKKGVGNIRFRGCKSLDERAEEYFMTVLRNIEKKAGKKYNNTHLIFVVNTYDYYEIWGNDSSGFIEKLITKIKEMKFAAEKIFIMVLNNQPLDNIDEFTYEIYG